MVKTEYQEYSFCRSRLVAAGSPALGAVRCPVVDTERSPRVEVLSGAYETAR
ncbi:hypothetical protein ACF07V_06220 [Streptomyces sp. NPDC015661]|uniref:hypothetical protein n=1 Tax=Streptomyces sp. NPDC015661 TaxID=3364961 RepID=UPI0036F64BDE